MIDHLLAHNWEAAWISDRVLADCLKFERQQKAAKQTKPLTNRG